MDITLLHNLKRHKCVLAEEIGHILFPPRSGHIAYHSSNFYELENRGNIEAIVAQDERQALTWATGVLMPNVEFWGIRKKETMELWELSEYFDVEEWFIRLKIAYIRMKAREQRIKIKWRDIIRRQ